MLNIKYYDKLILTEGCKYYVGRKSFPSMEQAISYLHSIPREKRLKKFGYTINILIENKHPLPFDGKSCLPEQLRLKDTKDVLCVYATERLITLSLDLDEIYTEYFEISKDGSAGGNVCIYDYGFLYGNYPKYTGTELCVSRISPMNQRHVTFVPESHGPYGVDQADDFYDGWHDIFMAYDSYFVYVMDDGRIYDDDNGSFPFAAIPVSTFVNIGLAGVYLKCWEKLTRSVEQTRACYLVDNKTEYLFRNALLDCKSKELPLDQEYYTITVLNATADGQIPSDCTPCNNKHSWEQLYPHAKYRTICIAPSFDAIYWENFELQDSSGQMHVFWYDYALLEKDFALQAGVTYHTDYWTKTRMGISDQTEITLTNLPEPMTVFNTVVDVDYACKGYLADDPTKVVRVPARTLSEK